MKPRDRVTSGKKAAATNRQKHGQNFYSDIASLTKGIQKSSGFYGNSERARLASIKSWEKRRQNATTESI